MDNIDNAYKFIKNVFDNNKVIIKDIEINKIIKLQIIIFDFNGKENNIEINLIYNTENKDYIINELSMKCNNFEEEISKLKEEMKFQINEINFLKKEINNLKIIINEKEKEYEKNLEIKIEKIKEILNKKLEENKKELEIIYEKKYKDKDKEKELQNQLNEKPNKTYNNNNIKNNLTLCKTVHHGIKCKRCFIDPLVGYRY